MANFNRLKDCVVTNKNVIVRVDINVPIKNGEIKDDTRIKAVIPTLKYLSENKAKVIVISHFGRPEGKIVPEMSISQLQNRIQEYLPTSKVHFINDSIGDKVQKKISEANYGDIILLENIRFYNEETKNDEEFSQKLASIANLYVNDAFSCSHRSHSSITGIPKFLKSAAGFLMEYELDSLTNLLENAKKPMMAAVGGAKVSTKINLLNSLSTKAQSIVIGGGMANSFLYALNKNIGISLCEKELKNQALEIMKNAKENNCEIILPIDVVVAKEFKENAENRICSIDEIQNDEMILDVGPKTIFEIENKLKNYQTFLWNGPLGAFEIEPFNQGTKNLAQIIANLTNSKKLISIAGGGDVVSALNSFNLAAEFTYISTAGGAFLEWLEGKDLPGITALKN
jgi:phosphoglycerate kinase